MYLVWFVERAWAACGHNISGVKKLKIALVVLGKSLQLLDRDLWIFRIINHHCSADLTKLCSPTLAHTLKSLVDMTVYGLTAVMWPLWKKLSRLIDKLSLFFWHVHLQNYLKYCFMVKFESVTLFWLMHYYKTVAVTQLLPTPLYNHLSLEYLLTGTTSINILSASLLSLMRLKFIPRFAAK